MAPSRINCLVTSFSGTGLPPTLSLVIPPTATITELREQLGERLPDIGSRLLLTTLSNRQLPLASTSPISDLLSCIDDDFLSLRLSVPICGGKGGFGSQLRAAGGRMSSRKKKTQGDTNGSSRNLDGRRLRTVTEAKALAEYLAIKPEMDRKEKEERRRRWQEIVETTEKKQDEIKNGNKGEVDSKWQNAKLQTIDWTRDAVLAAMTSGNYTDNLLGTSQGSMDSAGDMNTAIPEDEPDEGESSSKATTPPSDPESKVDGQVMTFFGFDEDDEFMSSDGENDGTEVD